MLSSEHRITERERMGNSVGVGGERERERERERSGTDGRMPAKKSSCSTSALLCFIITSLLMFNGRESDRARARGGKRDK